MRSLRSAFVVIALLSMATLALPQDRVPIPAEPWGTFVHQVPMGPDVAMPALVTLGMDGNLTVSSGMMFGGMPGATNRVGQILGVWKRTGPRSVGATSLMFVFDSNGILVGLQRDRCSLNFSRNFNSYQGVEFMETAMCPNPFSCPDPLDPATAWMPLPGMPETGIPVSGKRVQWLPAGSLNP